ncbi:MAG: polymerase sigma-70 factor, subfamily [Myxococcales bacterium]|nr:polymerase sigma-70 factor, subfamily [Myxococcales bacterium]
MVRVLDQIDMSLDDPSAPHDSDRWTKAFHEGARSILASVYREHFVTVKAAVSTVLPGADGETVIHAVFLRMITSADFRRAYRTGSFASWLFTVAKRQAIDYVRRREHEQPSGLAPEPHLASWEIEATIEARSLIRRFREHVLPAEWVSVFDARFVDQLDQRQAARAVGVPRTTLAYRELRIRRLLRKFLKTTTLEAT